MREIRRDPLSGRWVIIASDRAKRPHDYLVTRDQPRPGICPFCPGNEARTPPEVAAFRPHDGPSSRRDGPGWSVRAFPNRYPALMIEGGLERQGEGVYDRMNGVGAHEVIVETPDHTRQLADLHEPEVERVLAVWRDRMLDLRNDRRFRSILVFKNYGSAAGASLDHGHSQLIALPLVPRSVADELANARAFFQLKERCLLCDVVRQEVSQRVRMVHESSAFAVFAPYAPRFPFETWIVPRVHRASFDEITPAELSSLAASLRVALRKLRRALDDPPYNLVIRTAPLPERDGEAARVTRDAFHWHIEIMPALTEIAGFELGSGFFINPTPPEEAAQFLRDLDVDKG